MCLRQVRRPPPAFRATVNVAAISGIARLLRMSFWLGRQVNASPFNPPGAVGQSRAGYWTAGVRCLFTLHFALTTMNRNRHIILSSLLATMLATGACSMAPTKPMGTTSTTQSSGPSDVSPAMGSARGMHNANTGGLSRGEASFQQ